MITSDKKSIIFFPECLISKKQRTILTIPVKISMVNNTIYMDVSCVLQQNNFIIFRSKAISIYQTFKKSTFINLTYSRSCFKDFTLIKKLVWIIKKYIRCNLHISNIILKQFELIVKHLLVVKVSSYRLFIHKINLIWTFLILIVET